MSDVERAVMAIWQAWMELNTIVARDGVPYKFDGTKSDVSEEYFCRVKDDCASSYEELTGQEIKPWPPSF